MFPNSAITTSPDLFLMIDHCLFFWLCSYQNRIPTNGTAFHFLPSLVTCFQSSSLLLFPGTSILASNYFCHSWYHCSLNPPLLPVDSQKVKGSLLSILTVPVSWLSINLFRHCTVYFNQASAPISPWMWLMLLIMSVPFNPENICSDLLLFDLLEALDKVGYTPS